MGERIASFLVKDASLGAPECQPQLALSSELLVRLLSGRTGDLLRAIWLHSISSVGAQSPSFETVPAIYLNLLFKCFDIIPIIHIAPLQN